MVLIAVTGSAGRLLPAERGAVQLAIGFEHEDRAEAMRQAGALHRRFVQEAESHVAAGRATRWGSEQVRAWPERRYGHDGAEQAVVQVAAAEVRVRFRDLAALAAWATEAGSVPGVTLGGVEWTLTAQRRQEVQREVQVQAVQDAVRRAEAYAGAIGGTGVTLRRLWEPGLRPGASGGHEGGALLRSSAVSDGGAGIRLRPDDIEVSASISADFLLVR